MKTSKSKKATATPATPATPAPAPAPKAPERTRPFTPTEEGSSELLRLGKAQEIVCAFAAEDAAKEGAKKGSGVVRAQWGFAPHLPFALQWDVLSDAEQKAIRAEAVAYLTGKKISKKAAASAVLALGFRIRAVRSDSDPESRARSFLRAAYRAWTKFSESTDFEEFLKWAGLQAPAEEEGEE